MSQVPISPKEIKDQPVPLIDGTMSDASGSDSGGSEISPKEIPNIKVPRPVVASEVISESLDSQAREIKGNYTFAQMGAIQVGTDTNGTKMSPTGLLAVKNGVATVTITVDGDATFAGTVAAGAVISADISATLITGQIVNAQIANIDYAKINNVSVSSAQIQDGSITNAKIQDAAITNAKINDLSADKINAGSLSADRISGGTITGITIRTASSGSRVVMTSGSDQLQFYSGGGLTGVVENFGSGLGLVASSNLYLSGNGGGNYIQVTGSSTSFPTDIGLNNHNINGCTGVYLNGHYLTNGNSSGEIKMDGSNKTAIVPTSKGYNALYCMESPEVWFMDFCVGQRKFSFRKTWKFWKWGFDWIACPDTMFLEVTLPPYVIMPTLVKGVVQVWGHRKGHETKRFEEKTKAEFAKNEAFLGMAKVK
jgi:hypothetical protein